MTIENKISSLLAATDASLLRFDQEEEELRKMSPSEIALGRNSSDYFLMSDIFSNIAEHIRVIKADPKAFFDEAGRYNDKMINAYKGLVNTAMKALSELHRMRNADKMTAHILDHHTRDLVQSAAVEIGQELKSIADAAESGEDGALIATRVRRLLHRRLPEIFVKSASTTLAESKEEFGLSVH